ncbi:hypothetical protein F2Q68_00019364 [Brassica cretica]|uniref:Disease resistance R13L4/SHOC-2-like LRR domain-containing protein n=1 Tax=Brassica cretica TaxID=69181 RepID=A0A8S9FWU0_BRACR|nr:hypothetical protein F2Q68_00019364 [Brassica cretica]
MSNKIADLSGIPECLHLTTLLMQKNEALSNISNGFFRFMSKLVVLDLSYNRNLSELPEEISDLVSLQYLNMSKTNIECLPLGFRELKKLRYLNLEFTWNLSSIVGLSSLLDLKVLRLRGSGVSLDVSTVEELQVLEQLEILTLGIGYDSGLVQFLSSHRLISCIRDLEISGLQLESSGISFSTTMNNLQYLEFLGCTISEIKIDLTYSPLRSLMSPCFLSLSHVTARIYNKQEKASVGEESGIVPFLKLKLLRLSNVPELKNIYWSPLRTIPMSEDNHRNRMSKS